MLACSSDRETDSYANGLAALCDGLHEGFRRCGLPGAESSYCGYDPQGFRGSALAAVGACLRTEDCAQLGTDQPGEACFAEVRSTLPLSEGVIDYCESAATAYFRCNIWWEVEDCTQQVGLWSDDVLALAMTCHDHTCDTLETCEKLSFEVQQ